MPKDGGLAQKTSNWREERTLRGGGVAGVISRRLWNYLTMGVIVARGENIKSLRGPSITKEDVSRQDLRCIGGTGLFAVRLQNKKGG